MQIGKLVLIDTVGNIVIPFGIYSWIQPFKDGLAVVINGDWPNRQEGVIDTERNIVIPFGIYRWIGADQGNGEVNRGFDEGFAPAQKADGTWSILEIVGYNASTPESPITANPTESAVIVNGKQTAFDAYLIEANNYFKLRDLALRKISILIWSQVRILMFKYSY